MYRIKLKIFASVILVVVVAQGLAAGPSDSREKASHVLRLHGLSISAAAPVFSTTRAGGIVKADLAVTLDNVGRNSLVVSAADFALSAQGDIFSAQGWSGGHGRVKIGSKHSRVFRLTFTLPRAATKHLALFYRPANARASGSI